MRIKCIALVLGLAALSGVASAQNDKILMKDGKERSPVKIISEDYDGVRIELAGGTGSTGVRIKDIQSIKFGSAEKFYTALDLFTAGKLADALPQLEALAADTKLRPVVRHNVLYHLALTYQGLGQTDKAITQYQDLIKAFPKTRYLLSIDANLLDIYLAKGDLAGAQGMIDASLSAAQSGGMDTGLQAGFGVLRGRLLEQQKKFTEAQTLFDTTAIAAGADPDVVSAAKLGAARCAHAGGNVADATRRYQELTKADAPNSVLAGAWNGLGDIYMKEAYDKRDSEGMRDAALAYCRCVYLYIPEREASSAEFERALAGASLCFTRISELEADAATKKLYTARAKTLLDQLKRDYPQSRYIPK